MHISHISTGELAACTNGLGFGSKTRWLALGEGVKIEFSLGHKCQSIGKKSQGSPRKNNLTLVKKLVVDYGFTYSNPLGVLDLVA